MKKIVITFVLMMVTMFIMTSCNSNGDRMFFVDETPLTMDYMGPSRFDTLIVHEQIQPDKSVKYTFELRQWHHDIYTVEDGYTIYNKDGKELDFQKYRANGLPLNAESIESATVDIDVAINRIIEDDNISESDKEYVKAAYRQIFNHEWPTDWSTYK